MLVGTDTRRGSKRTSSWRVVGALGGTEDVKQKHKTTEQPAMPNSGGCHGEAMEGREGLAEVDSKGVLSSG